MDWDITLHVDDPVEGPGVDSIERVTVDDLTAAMAVAAALAEERGASIVTVMQVDAEKIVDPALVQSPDGTWWRMGVSDLGKPTFTPVE